MIHMQLFNSMRAMKCKGSQMLLKDTMSLSPVIKQKNYPWYDECTSTTKHCGGLNQQRFLHMKCTCTIAQTMITRVNKDSRFHDRQRNAAWCQVHQCAPDFTYMVHWKLCNPSKRRIPFTVTQIRQIHNYST